MRVAVQMTVDESRAGLHARFKSYSKYYDFIQEKQNQHEHKKFLSALKDHSPI